jgi:hypothetical protein
VYANVFVLLVAIVRPTWAALSDHTYATCAMKAFCIQRIWLDTRRSTSPNHQTKIRFTASSLVATISKASLVMITSYDITKSNTWPRACRKGRTTVRTACRRLHGSEAIVTVKCGQAPTSSLSIEPQVVPCTCIRTHAQSISSPYLSVLWLLALDRVYCSCSPDDTIPTSLLIPYQQISRWKRRLFSFSSLFPHRDRSEARITICWSFFGFFSLCSGFQFF